MRLSMDSIKLKELTAPCGLDCFNCEVYEENITEALKTMLARKLGRDKESLSCKGCRTQNGCSVFPFPCKTLQCVDSKGVAFCFECEDFPCKDYAKKLSESHKGDKRFKYRHELPSNLKRIRKIGTQEWLKEQKTRWRCPQCGGIIKFYHYTCSDCGFKKQI